MDNKTITNVLIGTVAIILGFVAGSLWTENKLLKNGVADTGTKQAAPAAPEANGANKAILAKVPEVTETDHVRGAENPKIYLIEYSDYECPFCNRFQPTMIQIMEEYGDQVAWVYRHYPLPFHSYAQKAAEAGECIAKYSGNEAFWTYTDSIYEDMQNGEAADVLGEENLLATAVAAGANQAQIQSCLDSDEMAEIVTGQLAGGKSAGIQGTPGTIIMTADGEYDLISGALPFEQVKTMIEQYL